MLAIVHVGAVPAVLFLSSTAAAPGGTRGGKALV